MLIWKGRMRVVVGVELELAGIPGLVFRWRRWWRSGVALLLEFHTLMQTLTVCLCV